MNAPVRLQAPEPNDLENLAQEFAECCGIQVWFVNEGWISKQRAVDNLQHLIESWKVPDEDRDTAQAIMAEAFAPIDQQLCEHCGLTVDRHRRVDTDEGPEFFCVDPRPEDLDIDELERRDDLRRQEEVAALVRRWEMADDRWRHIGEPCPQVVDMPVAASQPYRTPQSVIDAFHVVVNLNDPEYLSKWFAQHPQDASFLCALWERKNA
jgi:hypothetical protein